MILSKIAVMLVGLAGLCLSAPVKHAERSPFPGYRLLRISEEKPSFWVPKEVVEELSSGQLDFIDITDFQDANPSLAPKSALALPSGPSHQSVVNPLLAQIDSTLYQNNLVYFSSYRNRYYTSDYGVESAEWLFNTVSEMAANRSDITVTKFSHTFRQPSVIAKIQGTSSSAESVIIGAHQDSTAGSMPSGSAPGADDDGSGSMGILEIFRILIANGFRPQNTIEFQWYAAEEVGLLGSQAIAQSYSNNKIVVRSMMQLDMIAYDTKESTVGLVTDYVDAETVQFARTLVDEYLNIGWTNTVCGYGCSDHASWNRYGYPSCFPFEAQFRNRNPLIHTTMDTMSSVSIKHAVEFIKLGLAFAVELSYN